MSDSARQDARDAGFLMGTGVVWGTYFLRSKRVKATYLRAERKRETHVADPHAGAMGRKTL